MKDEYPHRELSAAIIGAAMEVLNGLRPGFDEKIYENSLVLELDCPRSSGRAAATFPRPLSGSSGRHVDPGDPC